MATEIIMPKLGMAMTEGTVVKWLKDDGAEVKKGQPVVVVMSKKITYDVEAPADGILRHAAQPKDLLGISEVLGFITAPGEAVPEVKRAPRVAAPAEAAAPAAAPVKKAEAAPEAPVTPSSPAARRLARELGVNIVRVKPAGERITESDVQAYYDARALIQASPLARKMAEEEGLDLLEIKGTGPDGRITEEDVLKALAERPAPVPVRPKVLPFSGMRQAIAEQMVYSLQSMAQLTIHTKADVTELASTRESLAARWGRKPSYTDLLVKAVVVALKDHPLLGSHLEGEQIHMPEEMNIGVAVALQEGLIVPVIRNADRLTVLQISDKIKDLAARARENALNVDEVTGAVFTITNLGMYGVDHFTPIINPPEVAILGVGRITEEVAWINGQAAARSKVALSLTLDHRVVDGAPGSAFLQTLVQLLEHPALIFAGEAGVPAPPKREG